MPSTRKTSPTFKKAQKCKYLPAGLRKIIEMKNRKMQNYVSFHFYINFIAKKSTTYAKFEKNSKNDQKIFLDAAGLRKLL